MDRCAIIATHHKTGTQWMSKVFRAIARGLGIPFLNLQNRTVRGPDEIKVPCILFNFKNSQSDFHNCKWLLEQPEYRILHVIRDPRDVVISAAHYHLKSQERWLHEIRRHFGGRSYQDKLKELDSDHARYLFEMRNSTARTIGFLSAWNYGMPNCIECKYEDLMSDFDMSLFSRIVSHLGFSQDELDLCRREFWNNSLFGTAHNQNRAHIRSGEVRQWATVFDSELAAAFLEQFGDVLVTLGYEADDSWATKLEGRVLERKN